MSEPAVASKLDITEIARRATAKIAANSTRAFDDKKKHPPLTCEIAHYWPCGWNIAIELATPDDTIGESGMIAKAAETAEAEQYMINCGRVFACGPTALTGETESHIPLNKFTPDIESVEQLVGKWVIFQKHTGLRLTVRATGQMMVICTVTELLGLTDDPKSFKYYL